MDCVPQVSSVRPSTCRGMESLGLSQHFTSGLLGPQDPEKPLRVLLTSA